MTGRPTPTRGALRVCRGVGLSAVSATLAIAAHALAGGGVPAAAPTVLLALVIGAVGVVMAGKRQSFWAIVAVLAVAQLATHIQLSVSSTAMPGMGSMGDLFGSPLMLAAHAVAVLLTGLLVVRADDVLFTLADAFVRLLPRIVVAPPVPGVLASLRPWVVLLARPIGLLSCRSHARRGPPLFA
jgi:hypothetical protein